ncbi:probable G-protein coupled receptor 160 [Morone saxatilis]|uniref:probable G-protein coupled receptor 160 n=1 Tax=Morone saxatilis TaxID=34816 RepID=UPI0015E1C9E1|nr:probable G-protein coupled receptor 160 [Morone saxatilis]XP_035513445.1 probable G-protein coupled receptor 160 [Morone saxatilis]
MLPESPGSPGISHTVKMLAIIEQWEVGSGCHTDNSEKYLLLILFKLGLDIMVFYLCCWKPSASFLNMCSQSVIMADTVMAFSLASVWYLGAERSPVSTCFLLAHASATYGALPLPMMFLGLLDYCLQDTYRCNQSAIFRCPRNAVLIVLGWMLAVLYSFGSVKNELIEVDLTTETKALVCEVEESTLITYFILVLFMVVLCVMLPFWSSIPQWLKEADTLAKMREEQENQRNDLFISTQCTETKISEGYYLEEIIRPPPSLWLSLMLGFGMFWMPYLAMSVICQVFGFGVPAYITFNLLWLECANSLIMGVLFWAKANTLGPDRNIPKNVCLWHIYWYLSKRTQQQQQQQRPIAVLKPSKDNALLHV